MSARGRFGDDARGALRWSKRPFAQLVPQCKDAFDCGDPGLDSRSNGCSLVGMAEPVDGSTDKLDFCCQRV